MSHDRSRPNRRRYASALAATAFVVCVAVLIQSLVKPDQANATRPSERAAPSSRSDTVQSPALVNLAISPWGEVVVDGRSLGASPPLSRVKLVPGAHRIEIRNGALKAHVLQVRVRPNETLQIKHKF